MKDLMFGKFGVPSAKVRDVRGSELSGSAQQPTLLAYLQLHKIRKSGMTSLFTYKRVASLYDFDYLGT